MLLFILLSILNFSGDSVNTLSKTENTEKIQNFRIAPDPKGAFTYKDVEKLRWYSGDSANAVLNEDCNVYWAQFSFVNQSNIGGNWLIDMEKWTQIEIYKGDFNTAPTLSGHLVPFRQKDFPYANYNLISFELKAHDTLNFLVKLEKSKAYFAVPQQFDFKVSSTINFYEEQTQKRLLLGLFLGFYLIMFAHNLFIYLSTKDRYYIHYLIILAALLCLTLHNSGYTLGLMKFFDDYCLWHPKMQFILSAILGVNMILFTRKFLHLKKEFPTIDNILKVLLILVVLMPLPSFFGNAVINEMISGLLGTLTMVVIMVTAIRSFLRKFPSSNYFVVGYGAFTLGIITLLLSFMGVLPEKVQEYYPMNIGSSIEMIFFSIALGNRINLLSRDNEEKQKEIIHQLRKNEELQTKVNRELEEKVLERTEEIRFQKEIIEQEKEKSDALLLNILPASTANELKDQGYSEPKQIEEATVLFTDVVGFTKIGKKLSAAELVVELDYYFKGIDEIITKYNLEKIKTIGDSYMALGGAPEKTDNFIENTVLAAKEMLSFVQNWNLAKAGTNKDLWEIRLGIHVGPIVAGVVGKKKFTFDIWGDTVNIASRMESGSKPGRITISADMYEKIKDKFPCTYRGLVKDKNGIDYEMYFIDE